MTDFAQRSLWGFRRGISFSCISSETGHRANIDMYTNCAVTRVRAGRVGARNGVAPFPVCRRAEHNTTQERTRK